MQKADDFIAWFQSHRTVLGSGFLGVSTIMAGAASIYGHDGLLHMAGVVALVGTTLVGSGAAKSDQFYRERKEVIETKVDRRAPRSGATIPPVDLAKLEAKVEDKPLPPPPYKEVPPSNGGD